MGFLSDLFGGTAAKAAQNAARAQQEAADRAIAEQRRATEQARSDLQPFRAAGEAALPGLQGLVTDPNQQQSFIQQNPFFKSLADNAQRRLFSNQAARGKVGSGGTAEALQNSLLLLGNDLVGRSITQRQNLAGLGANAAAGQASGALATGQNIGNLLTYQGDAQASGLVGAANARSQGAQNILSTATGLASLPTGEGTVIGKLLALCDERFKDNIKRVGTMDSGVPVYTFTYKGDSKTHIGVLAQELEQVKPEAVHTVNGVKMVDYEAA